MILYEHDEVNFKTLGLGTLYDCMDDVVVEETNGIFEVTFDYPINGIHFSKIRFRRIVYCKPNPYSEPEPFRIYEISTPINGIVSISAHHISYDTSGFPIDQFTTTNMQQVVDKLNSSNIVNHRFLFKSDISAEGTIVVPTPTSIRTVMGDNIMDVFKPEYQYNKFEISILKKRGSETNQVIRYGNNLIDYNQEENIANVYTSVYPYWTNHGNNEIDIVKTLPEKIVATPGTWEFSRVLTLDLSSNFKEEPTDDQMREATAKYITDNEIGIPTVSLSVSFLHLSDKALLLGDTVIVDFVLAKIKTVARCVKTSYSPTLDRYVSIDIGKPQANIANTIVGGFNETSKQISETKVYVDTVVGSSPGSTTNASSLTTGSLSSTNKNFKMNIDTGEFTLGGINGIAQHGDDSSEWGHADGSKTTANYSGLSRDGAPYHNLMQSGIIDITDTNTFRAIIHLPSMWIGRTFEVIINVEDTKNTSKNVLLDIKTKVVNKNIVDATFEVEGFITTKSASGSDLNTPVKLRYIAIGG